MPIFQNLWKTFFQSEQDQLVEKYTKFAVHSGEFASKKKKDSKSPEKTQKEVTVWVAQIREGVTPVYYRDLLFVFLTQIQFHIHKESSSVVEATHKIVKKRRCKFVLGHDEENGRILLANFEDETKEAVSDFWKKLFMELGALLAKNGVLRDQTLLPLPEIKRPKDLNKDINDITDIFNVNASGSGELISRQIVWNTSRQLWKAFLRPDVREKSIKILFINFVRERDFVVEAISTTKVKVSAHTGVLRLDCIMQFAPNQANENVLSVGYNDQVDFFDKGPFLPDLADLLVKYKLLREQTGRMHTFKLNDSSFEDQLNNPLDDDAFGSPEDLRLPAEVQSGSPNSAKFIEPPERHPAQEPPPEIIPTKKSPPEAKFSDNHNNQPTSTESVQSTSVTTQQQQHDSNGHYNESNNKTDSIPQQEASGSTKTQSTTTPKGHQESSTMKIQELSVPDLDQAEEDSFLEYHSKETHQSSSPVQETIVQPENAHQTTVQESHVQETKPLTHARPLSEKGRELTEDDLRKLVEREEQKWKLEEAKHQQEFEEQERLREAEEQQRNEQKMKNEIVQQKLQLELVDLIHQIESLVNRYGPLTESSVQLVSQHTREEYKQHLLELQDKLDNKVTMLTFQPTSLSQSQTVNMEQLALQTLATITSQLAILAQAQQEEEERAHTHQVTHHEEPQQQQEQQHIQVEESSESHQQPAEETTQIAADIGETDEIDLNSPEPEVFTNEDELKQTTEEDTLQ